MRDKQSECPLLSAEYALGSDEPVRLLGNACRGLSSGFEPAFAYLMLSVATGALVISCEVKVELCFTTLQWWEEVPQDSPQRYMRCVAV